MTAKLFVKEINTILDQNKNLEDLSPNKFRIKPRKHQTAFKDELSYLINNYVMEEIEIGMFTFLESYSVMNDYLIFGKYEMDLLAIDRITREIVLIDHDQTDYVMMKCAKGSNEFIELLFFFSKLIIKQLFNFQTNIPNKKRLYEISGGEAYKSFVDYIFGNSFD